MNEFSGPSAHDREGDLLDAALELPAPERAAFLDRACADDAALRERLERLIEAHAQAGTFLESAALSRRAAALAPTKDARAPDEIGGRIGRYKLLEKLGEGGWGTVYVAEQTEPVRRRVALKVIRPGMDSRAVIARFEAERQALAMMDHPNIAKFLDAGVTGDPGTASQISNLVSQIATGRPYFVMELVRGIKLTDYCDGNRLGTAQRLDLFIKVCRAIQHAHQKGIIHRDIKPSNILVTLHDGVPVPKVIDFGIAKAIEGRLTDATVYTQLHQFIGTPAYMSPEQAEMSSLDIDTRSDIYSLGVLLYELLVGRTPFDPESLLASGLDALRKTIREEEPVRPSTRLAALTDDERTTTSQRRGAEPPRLIHQLRGDLDWIVMKCLEKDRARRYETANGLARDLERHLQQEPITARPPSPTNAPTFSLAYSPDGEQIAIGLYVAPAILIADADNGRVLMELGDGGTNIVSSLAFSRNGSQLAAATLGGEVDLWEISSGRLTRRIGTSWGQVWQVGFDASGRRLVTAHWDGAARVWNVETGALEHTLEGTTRPLQCALFSPQGDRIYTAGWDEQVRVWDAASFKEIGRLPKGHGIGIISIALSRDGRHLLTGSWDGEAKLWEAERLDEPPTFRAAFWPEQRGGLHRFFGELRGPYVTLSPTSNTGLVLSPAPSNEVVVVDFARQRELFRISTGHRGNVTAFAVAPDLRRLVTAADDGSVFVWDARQGARLFALEGHTDRVNGITFSPDNRRIVTASAEGTARVWDNSGRLLKTLAVGQNVFIGVISPDSRWIAFGVDDGQNAIWSLENGHPVHKLPHRDGGAFGFAWTADSRRVVSAGYDMVARVWEVSSGTLLAQCQGHAFPIWAIALSPDGTRLVTASMDHTARVWDVATGHELLTLAGHTSDVHSVAWSSDGRQIVTGSDDQTMKIWEAATPEDIAAWQAEEAEALRPRETARK